MAPSSISINGKVPMVCFLSLSSAAVEHADGSLCRSAGPVCVLYHKVRVITRLKSVRVK